MHWIFLGKSPVRNACGVFGKVVHQAECAFFLYLLHLAGGMEFQGLELRAPYPEVPGLGGGDVQGLVFERGEVYLLDAFPAASVITAFQDVGTGLFA